MKEVAGEEDNHDNVGFHDNPEDSVLEGSAKDAKGTLGKTATNKCGRSRKGKEVDAAQVFGDGGPLHALMWRALPIWNSSTSAVDVDE